MVGGGQSSKTLLDDTPDLATNTAKVGNVSLARYRVTEARRPPSLDMTATCASMTGRVGCR